METESVMELRDAKVYPDEKVLMGILGASFSAYSELLKLYEANGLVPEWRFYNDGKAWLCKVQKKGRTIVWMSAWRGYMKATVYFPERHLDALYGLDISGERKLKIRETKNTGKSKPCVFEIRDTDVLPDFAKIMLLKIEAK